MRHIDKLNQLLRSYNTAMSNMEPVESRLLQSEIKMLNMKMDKGVHNHNWFSLSIDEYIKICNNGISTFQEIKNIVLQHAQNIELKVVNIENAQIVKQINFERKTPMDITEFSEYFESHMKKVLDELVNEYQDIGNLYLKSIDEQCTVKSPGDSSQSSTEMETYYMYWERRIFNAITKMIVRALAANKTLFQRIDPPYLIYMTASYNHPGITFHPSLDELKTQIDKFSRNILESANRFGRWWRGHCRIFEEKTREETGEKYLPYTFASDIMQNKMISQLQYEIIQQKTQIINKFDLLEKGWIKRFQFKLLFNKNEQIKAQKQIEKNQQTQEIENRIVAFGKHRAFNQAYDNEQNNYFVLIDMSEVKESTIEKIGEWI